MISVVIVGTGNVAKHLFDAFLLSEKVQVDQVVGRNKAQLQYFEEQTETTTDFDNVRTSEILIIAVKDDAIGNVSKHFEQGSALIAHTSGSVDLQELNVKRKSVLYPLQTFTEGQEIDFTSIPICIEAENKTDLQLLKKVGKSISHRVFEISTKQRRSIHLAAVFVNNFTNHLYHIGEEICEESNVSFDMLKPLIQETSNKIKTISPKVAQTGPAKRNDMKTLHTQLTLLNKSEHREVYKTMTNAIKASYGKEL